MSQPQPDQNAVPEGYRPAAVPPYQGQQNQNQQSQNQPYQGQQSQNQQPGNQAAPQYQAVPQQYAAPQQPYPGQAPQLQPYPQQFAAPQQHYPGQSPQPQQHYPGQSPQPYQQAPQHGHYQAQPQMPNYGYAQPKSKVAAGLLGIFLGGLGIHRFYLGFTKIAVIQLILTLVLGVFTFGLVGLWGVVEGIMIIAGSARFRVDAQGIPLRD